MKKIFRHWKIFYLICSLVYIGWVIHVGGNEFDRINSQYRTLAKQLEPERIKAVALEELAAACRKASREQDYPETAGCSDWPPAAVAAKSREVEERQLQARKRGLTKVILFYTGFVVIFLVTPVILLYLLIVGILILYRNIRIVR